MITPVARKVCMLGEFGVGKTSLVARFVHNTFSEQYLTTVGVKVDSKAVTLPADRPATLVLWDIAGKNGVDALDQAYLRGSHGVILVVDGTLESTFHSALQLHTQVAAIVGNVPALILLNKVDLVDHWELEPQVLAGATAPMYRTSAKTGEGVEAAFMQLAQLVYA